MPMLGCCDFCMDMVCFIAFHSWVLGLLPLNIVIVHGWLTQGNWQSAVKYQCPKSSMLLCKIHCKSLFGGCLGKFRKYTHSSFLNDLKELSVRFHFSIIDKCKQCSISINSTYTYVNIYITYLHDCCWLSSFSIIHRQIPLRCNKSHPLYLYWGKSEDWHVTGRWNKTDKHQNSNL